MMEYTSINDFYIKLNAIYNKDRRIIDYILVYVSDNFYKATNVNPDLFLNKKISEIVVEHDNTIGLKDYYFNIYPKSKSKYNIYIKELNRHYLINMFPDNNNNKEESLIIFYNDVSDIRKNIQQQLIQTNSEKANIYYLKDKIVYNYKDKLTGLYNKDFFQEELKRLDSKRQLPISIIIGSINGLKLINDAFGNNLGDKTIKKTAEIIKNIFRKEDIISRVSGDEFAVLLPKTSEEVALKIVERIKNDCEKNPLDFIKISISLGVATKQIEDENIYEIYKNAEERMHFQKFSESKDAKLSIINFLKSKLEKISFESKAHYERLKELSLMMADSLNISYEKKYELSLLCEWHDIGKIGIPKIILQKQEVLDKKEWEDIKRHSVIGYNIIKEWKVKEDIDELILTHHERWDGQGYPGLLKGDEIPIAVRIFSIADAYDAMVNGRPYKTRMTNKEALIEIKEKAGSQFDPLIANIFINGMENKEQIV